MLLTIGIGRFQKEDYYVGNNSNKNLAMKENSFNTFLLIISNISHEAFNDNATHRFIQLKSSVMENEGLVGSLKIRTCPY